MVRGGGGGYIEKRQKKKKDVKNGQGGFYGLILRRQAVGTEKTNSPVLVRGNDINLSVSAVEGKRELHFRLRKRIISYIRKGQDVENRKKDWESLGLSNDFLFGKVMRNHELCKEMLELILGVDIERLEYSEAQKSIDEEKDAKGVRLDVYVKNGNGEIYNIEVQALDTEELPKRSRYYSSMIDLQELNKGETYWKLKQSYVIFICTFDVFGEGRYRYTFENVCLENTEIRLKDETTKIFLNTEGTAEDISGELKAFLDYVGGRESDNGYVKRLAKEMEKAKQNREWRREYMTLLMRDQENLERGIKQGIEQGIKQGRAEGIEQGEERFAILNRRLLRDKRYDDLEKISGDKVYRQKLYEEYHII